VKERLKPVALLGLSVVFQQRLRTEGVIHSSDPTIMHGKFEIARWFATGATVKIIQYL